jgi:CelD/BcsL family acetyltransferase involved in cellulose biosynthesis
VPPPLEAVVPPDGVVVVRDLAGIDSIRADWERLQGDRITTDPDYFAVTVEADPKIVRPHVVLLRRGGAGVAMLVARLETLKLNVRLGYKTVYAPRVRSLTIVSGGVLGNPGDADFEALLASLRASLAGGEADMATFHYLPVDSAFLRIAGASAGPLGRQHFLESELHWELELPESFDAFLATLSSSTRKNVRQLSRRLESKHGEGLELRTFTEPSELDAFFGDVEAIAAKTYQRGLGVSFGDTSTHRARTTLSMEQGWFRGYVLYLDGQPSAYQAGELYGQRYRASATGFDPELGQLRVGTYLLMRVIADLAQLGARVLDYGVGDADYKRSFGTSSTHEAKLVLYAPTFRARRINFVRTAVVAAEAVGKRVLGPARLSALRRQWRARLQRRSAQ